MNQIAVYWAVVMGARAADRNEDGALRDAARLYLRKDQYARFTLRS